MVTHLPCSSNTISFHPSLAKWYATDDPMTPPPQTTISACVGGVEPELSHLDGLFWGLQHFALITAALYAPLIMQRKKKFENYCLL